MFQWLQPTGHILKNQFMLAVIITLLILIEGLPDAKYTVPRDKK